MNPAYVRQGLCIFIESTFASHLDPPQLCSPEQVEVHLLFLLLFFGLLLLLLRGRGIATSGGGGSTTGRGASDIGDQVLDLDVLGDLREESRPVRLDLNTGSVNKRLNLLLLRCGGKSRVRSRRSAYAN